MKKRSIKFIEAKLNDTTIDQEKELSKE